VSVKRGGLGTNLDALIPLSLSVSGTEVARQDEVSIDSITPNPKQPRRIFDEDSLRELTESIKEVGLLQPPVVREIAPGHYELIMGERRLRAAKAAGHTSIPVIIRQTSDNELLREALIENIHRSQLNALEEGAAYAQLLNDFGCTHEELARRLGKSRPHLTNTMRLLNLPASVQRKVAAGVLSPGHARALLALTSEAEIERLASRIVAEGLSVRVIEEIVAIGSSGSKKKIRNSNAPLPELLEIAERLSDHYDTRVTVQSGKEKGRITIEFAGLPDLRRILDLLEDL
jgi:ParB family chromosome partitioning protein